MEKYLEGIDLERREQKILNGLDVFSKHFKGVDYIHNAALLITATYNIVLQRDIKGLVPKRVNKFKIASLCALTVVKIQPAKGYTTQPSLTEKQRRKLNSELAYFMAMNIILDIQYPGGINLDTGITLIDDSTRNIKEQHLTYLAVKNLNDFPVFPISSFYYCYFLIFQMRFNALIN